MSFINEKLSREKIKALVKKYHISDPRLGVEDDRFIDNLVYRCAYDPSNDALFGLIRNFLSDIINGNGVISPPNGDRSIGVLIWQGYATRINYYEDLMEIRKEVWIMVTKIIAPNELKGKDEEIIKLLGDATITFLTANLPPSNQDDKYIFKPTNITFTNKEDIWRP